MLFYSRCVYERTEKVELSEKMELKVSNDDFRSLNNYDFWIARYTTTTFAG